MSEFEKAKQLFIEALNLVQQDDLLGAKQRLLDAHRLVPDRVSVITNLAAVLLKLRAPEAKEFALKAVALDESNVEGWLNLSTCNEIEGNLAEALDCVDRLITVKPNLPEAFERQAVLLRKLGRMDEAFLSQAKAQTLAFSDAGAYSDYGVALCRLMRFEEAITAFDKAVSLDSNHAAAYVNRGNVLQELKRNEEALASYDNAIALQADHAEAYNNRGLSLKELKRHEEALESYDKAIALRADYADAYNNRGNVLQELKRYEDALASYDRAIALKADYAEAYNNRGNVLVELKRHADAVASYDQAIALKTDYAEAYNNRGNVLSELKRYTEALASYNKAIALKADYAEAYNNRGFLLKDLTRYAEALADYDRAIALKADFADAHFNKGLLTLAGGEFKQGWELYEWRWRTADLAARGEALGVSLWVARERIRGADLLLCAEQGVGDEIMFAGMVDEVLREANSVILECDARLLGLYQRSFPAVKVIARQSRSATEGLKFDCVVPVGSLARFYRTSPAGFPQHGGYLKPSADLTAMWRRKLSVPGASLKVGISWRGGTPRTGIGRRSIPLDRWGPIFDVKGAQFVSLQYGDVKEEIAKWGDRIIFFPDCQNTFDDLGALISALDVVISVQTAAVHLTGALGKPCWALVSDPAEWRYGQNGSQMPWYPAVRLFRQRAAGDWQAVLDEVTAELGGLSKSLSKGECNGAAQAR